MDLDRELDRVKTKVFLGKQAAFLGSIMCSLEFHWDTKVETAGTNGLKVLWNPDWFTSLSSDTRSTVLLHELWHVARLHQVRLGNRDPKIFNYACDIRINNDLRKEGYSFEGTNPWIMPELDDMDIIAEEDIYDYLMSNSITPPPNGSWGVGSEDAGDMLPQDGSSKGINDLINVVVRANQQAQLSSNAGKVPGEIEAFLNKFLNPIIPWEKVLKDFFTEMSIEEYSWRRPNKRYRNVYMPGINLNEDGLEHLCYYLDVSGSVTDEQIIRFNSELKYIIEEVQPKKMTVVQFDTSIQKEQEFVLGDDFNGIHVIGRGGTDLFCVKEHIDKHKPTAAVIFTDLDCLPIGALRQPIPIIWAVLNNPQSTVPFGKMVHIPREM